MNPHSSEHTFHRHFLPIDLACPQEMLTPAVSGIQTSLRMFRYIDPPKHGGRLHPDFQLLDAAKDGDFESAVRAIAAGADPNAVDVDDATPLYNALTQGHLPLAHFLVSSGADVNTRFGKRNQTLLHWAAEHGSYGVCNFLLQYKADINAQRSDGATPLILAARGGHEYLVRLLLKHDAYLSPKTSRNVTARSAAAKNQHSSIVKLIDEAAVTRPGILKDADAAFQSKSGERFLF